MPQHSGSRLAGLAHAADTGDGAPGSGPGFGNLPGWSRPRWAAAGVGRSYFRPGCPVLLKTADVAPQPPEFPSVPDNDARQRHVVPRPRPGPPDPPLAGRRADAPRASCDSRRRDVPPATVARLPAADLSPGASPGAGRVDPGNCDAARRGCDPNCWC